MYSIKFIKFLFLSRVFLSRVAVRIFPLYRPEVIKCKIIFRHIISKKITCTPGNMLPMDWNENLRDLSYFNKMTKNAKINNKTKQFSNVFVFILASVRDIVGNNLFSTVGVRLLTI